MSARRKGTAESRLGCTWQSSRRGGEIVTDRYKFPLEMLDSYRSDFRSKGYVDYNIQHDGNSPDLIAEVRIPLTGDPGQPLVDLWDPKYNEVQQSLWLNKKVQTELEKITDITGRALFKADLESLLAGNRYIIDTDNTQKEISFDIIVDFVVRSFGVDKSVITKLFTDLSHGVEYQLVSTKVLTRHLLLEPDADLLFLDKYINKLVTTADLIRYEATIPDNIALTLVDGYWLKKAPVGGQEEIGRWNFEYEWWYAERIGELEKDNIVTPTP